MSGNLFQLYSIWTRKQKRSIKLSLPHRTQPPHTNPTHPAQMFTTCVSLLLLLALPPVHSIRSTLASTSLRQFSGNRQCTTDDTCRFPRGVCTNHACECRSPFAGAHCENTEEQLLCEPHCTHKGYCNPRTKSCECTPDYVGESCTILCLKDDKNVVCGGKGLCSAIVVQGVPRSECVCQPGFTGKTCSRKVCPTTSNGECNGSGKCIDGKCHCLKTYTGIVCNERECNMECGEHGSCSLQTQTCKCEKGWFGKSCEFKTCPTTRFGVCGGHGLCDEATGVCACDDTWTGGSCHIPRCVAGTNIDCSGHGRCRAEKCHCALGWAGQACEKNVCPLGCLASAGRGKCVGGVCECAPGFLGTACESKEQVPLECGGPCHQKCINLPLADDSAEHCEQIQPIEIGLTGTFAKTNTSFSLADGGGKKQFPGMVCYQKCYTHCVQGCFDQMHPFMKKMADNFVLNRK